MFVLTVTLEKFLSFWSIRLLPYRGDELPSHGIHDNKRVKVIGVFTWPVKSLWSICFMKDNLGSKLNYKVDMT